MSWDFKIDPLTNDLTSGYVTGSDEVCQRIKTRLRRELGEWFLATQEGLPWYGNDGDGILGSKGKHRNEVLLLIRRCITATEGVDKILELNTTYTSGDRSIDIYAQVLLINGDVGTISILSFQGNGNE